MTRIADATRGGCRATQFVTLLLASAVIAGCSSGGIVSGAPESVAAPTATPTAVTDSPSPTTDAEAVIAVVRRFEEARIGGDYAAAWALIAPFSQPRDGRDAWAVVDRSVLTTTGTDYVIEPPDLTWASLNPAYHDEIETDVQENADRSRAFGVIVVFPRSTSASLGRQDLIVAPLRGDGWRIWFVH